MPVDKLRGALQSVPVEQQIHLADFGEWAIGQRNSAQKRPLSGGFEEHGRRINQDVVPLGGPNRVGQGVRA